MSKRRPTQRDETERAYMFRSAHDYDNVAALAIRKASYIGGQLRQIMLQQIGAGNRINIKGAMEKTFKPILQKTFLASHLLGIRRLYLIKKDFAAPELKLSATEDAAKILKDALDIDLDELQALYETSALKIVNHISEVAEHDLRETLGIIIKQGLHRKEALETLAAKFDALGLTERKPYQLETIFRTQASLAYQAGKYQAEQSPEVQQYLWGYKYVTVGDDRVREEHAAIEYTTLPKDDAFWQRFYPPNGWNCRCQVIPLFEEREVVQAPTHLDDGSVIEPDKGFNFNPGVVFATSA